MSFGSALAERVVASQSSKPSSPREVLESTRSRAFLPKREPAMSASSSSQVGTSSSTSKRRRRGRESSSSSTASASSRPGSVDPDSRRYPTVRLSPRRPGGRRRLPAFRPERVRAIRSGPGRRHSIDETRGRRPSRARRRRVGPRPVGSYALIGLAPGLTARPIRRNSKQGSRETSMVTGERGMGSGLGALARAGGCDAARMLRRVGGHGVRALERGCRRCFAVRGDGFGSR